MGIQHDIEEALARYEITPIDGQPNDADLTKLEQELTAMAATIPTTNGGGSHGHIGMLIEDAEYTTFSAGGVPFVIPTNPGAYPATVDPDVVIRERQIAEHKFEIKEFETYLGVENALRNKIIKAVNPEWLEGIRHTTVGFTHLTPKDMLDHLKLGGVLVDYMDVSEITSRLLEQWDGSENPATRFARDDQLERQLVKAGMPPQQQLRLAIAQTFARSTGEYDAYLREFEQRPVADRTFANFRPGFVTEFANRNKSRDTAKGAGFGVANAATEQERIDEENVQFGLALASVAEVIQEGQSKQFEKMMTMLTTALGKLDKPGNPGNPNQPKDPNQPRYPKCKHCNLHHLHEDKCWELEANAASRPANWKPVAERRKGKASE